MPIYEVTQKEFRRIEEKGFSASGLKERSDIQRLLRTQIDVIAEDLYVLTEEFSEWEESKRRIDLLAIDANANLVVIEIKRTTEGGHMELQAIRYAAMVSAMTFQRAVQIHADFLANLGEDPANAKSRLLEFLDWSEPNEDAFAADTRIILVSADFGKELTTSVLWLIDHGIDIQCVRIKPYKDQDRILVDVQQIIPLQEANDYQIQLREKDSEGRKQRAERYDILKKFWEGVVAYAKTKGARYANVKPGAHAFIVSRSGIRGLGLNLVVGQLSCQAELYIDRGEREENKSIFDQLIAHRTQIEAAFPFPIEWERLDHRRASRIKSVITDGGYRTPEANWSALQQALIERMTTLEKALRPYLDTLQIQR
jgi:Domain of unknown function (DUF4268)